MTVHQDTQKRLNEVVKSIDSARGLIICDADEVILKFVATLEQYLTEQDLYLRLDSFALSGNIRKQEDDEVVAAEDVGRLMQDFFQNRVSECPPVDHAVDALAHLAQFANIVILTNLPHELREAREQALVRLGMPYPVIANSGLKGKAVNMLTQGLSTPCAFLDDLPPNIASVAQEANKVRRIHFIADERLRPLLGQAEDAHARIDCWLEARDYLEAYVRDPGLLP